MSAGAARALTRRALLDLQEALEIAERPEDFLAHATAIVTNLSNTLALPYDSGDADPLIVGALGSRGRDIYNAAPVYEFVGAIDRANASDGRLWTYLAFVTYRDYMEQRWPLVGDKWKNRVRDRWLLTGSTRGSLIRHGIARLWWIANLTYDPHLEQPLTSSTGDAFAYTKAILGNEDRVLGLFDREAGGIPSVVRGVLDHVESDPSRSADTYIRKLMKEVTLAYGYRDLMAMTKDQVRVLIDEAAGL